ncbi:MULTISPECIES: hypothetical protein [unclassified Bacillus (in: firmicutes)]|uniref:hypothetical protein n=1 Tax=unclassified Bacillus (in: firmicutes) TaxID=185979 RepID=UPI0008EC75ED|nr:MULTISPECIES: hypothetical protein [unclassified Bacillus (in: firmicutes)]SFJ51055.1 hypothetical protein SAMN04488574_11553 [Bacillus sp. 71mf]SFT04857.1 hypothetical protein SAMN04488145_108134 [Bacillus sp. 103mf]
MGVHDVLFKSEKLEEFILNESTEIMGNLNNKEKFISSFICYFMEVYRGSECDYVELFDVDGPDYINVEFIDRKVIVTATLFAGLSIWLNKKALGKVTATIEGVYSFILIDKDSNIIILDEKLELDGTSFAITNFKVEKLQSIDQYFDDYTIL